MSKDITMKKLLVIAVSFFLLVITSGCLNIENKEINVKDEISIAIAEPSFGFYPWHTSYDVSSISLNHNIFNTLVSFDRLFKIKAELAESWNNPDNLTWRFRIRKDVIFHNGYDLTAEDIKYSIDIIKNNESNVLRDLLLSVNETIIIDNYTLDIITYEPTPILLNKLTDIFIVSKKYQEETKEIWPIGTGAYKVVDFFEGRQLELERFEDYWKAKPDIKKAKIMFIEDGEERMNALLNGTADIAENIFSIYYENLSKEPGIKLYMITHPTVTYISFNFDENYTIDSSLGEKNPLADVRVRKALYYAINISEVIEEAYIDSKFAEPASQFLTPLIFGYNPNITRLPYNLTKARELLNQSGYGSGFNLSLDCAKEATTQIKVCDVIDEQLSKIINFSLNRLSLMDYYDKICSANTSCYILGWMAATGDGSEIYDYMIRTVDKKAGIGSFNLGNYSNPEVDRIGEEINYIMDYEERLDLMQQGFEIAMDDVAWIPLLSSKLIYGVSEDFIWEPSNTMSIYIEEIKV